MSPPLREVRFDKDDGAELHGEEIQDCTLKMITRDMATSRCKCPKPRVSKANEDRETVHEAARGDVSRDCRLTAPLTCAMLLAHVGRVRHS